MGKLRSICLVAPAVPMLRNSAATRITPLMFLTLLLALNAGCKDDRGITQTAEDTDVMHGDEADREVYEALQRIVPQVDWRATPFHLAIEDLRHISGLKIEPDWEMMAAAAIEKDAEVSMWVRDASLKIVLEILLCEGASLDYIVEKGAIVISTEEAIAKMKNERGVGSRS